MLWPGHKAVNSAPSGGPWPNGETVGVRRAAQCATRCLTCAHWVLWITAFNGSLPLHESDREGASTTGSARETASHPSECASRWPWSSSSAWPSAAESLRLLRSAKARCVAAETIEELPADPLGFDLGSTDIRDAGLVHLERVRGLP